MGRDGSGDGIGVDVEALARAVYADRRDDRDVLVLAQKFEQFYVDSDDLPHVPEVYAVLRLTLDDLY
ncbi:hypothetical protein SDC9_178025 [bioreactor metagenome]|uniref:Uncharacterized protein n=1 Tax=bioreactor metagenome TaxID=1076179 RepID=A0A645H2H6_9ZZZZ